MPIVGTEENVRIEYTIPDNIKKLATDDFLKEFRNQLFRIHKHYSLNTFADEGLSENTSTFGWYAAFYKACRLTKKRRASGLQKLSGMVRRRHFRWQNHGYANRTKICAWRHC